MHHREERIKIKSQGRFFSMVTFVFIFSQILYAENNFIQRHDCSLVLHINAYFQEV
jgi:hypothetical protein